EASLKKLQLDFVDLYLIHTPFAFQPGDEQDPRDQNGAVIYDKSVTLLDTWRALEGLVDEGRCKAIGLSDVSLEQAKGIFDAARIKPAVVHVESHPYLQEWELLKLLQREWHRVSGLRGTGAQQQAEFAGRSCRHRHCPASRQNPGASSARLGHSAWHGSLD